MIPIRTQWKYLDGRFVTGHVSRFNFFVDKRDGAVNFMQDTSGKIWALLIPAKGVDIERKVLPARITKVTSASRGNLRITDVEVEFDGKTVPLNVGRNLFTIPETDIVTRVISPRKITGYLVVLLIALVLYAVLGIHLSAFNIVVGFLILTILYVLQWGFKEKKFLDNVKFVE